MRAVLKTTLTCVGVFWIIAGLLGPGGLPALVAGALLLWGGLIL